MHMHHIRNEAVGTVRKGSTLYIHDTCVGLRTRACSRFCAAVLGSERGVRDLAPVEPIEYLGNLPSSPPFLSKSGSGTPRPGDFVFGVVWSHTHDLGSKITFYFRNISHCNDRP
jgi:hypothetical protein